MAKDSEIFDSTKENNNAMNEQGYAGEYNRKKKAEDERLKGNEYMMSKEY